MKKKTSIKKIFIRSIFFLTLLVLICAIGIFIADKAIEKIVHKNKEIAVPNIVGLNFEIAREILKNYNLEIEKDYEVFDKNYEIDSIISQIPTANSIVREKIIIKVVTSKGDDEFGMPNIVKMDIRNAETTLKNHGLIIEEIQYAYSLNTEENKIIYQNPSANDIVTRGSVVNITISKGLPPNTIKLMPSVLGLKKDVVKILMENVGVEYTLDYIPVFDEKRKGIAIEQFPSGDSIIKDEQIVVIRIGE